MLRIKMRLPLAVLPRDYQETTMSKRELIKNTMREDPMASAAAIANRVGLSESGVQYHIKKMKANGEIERLGADFGGRWKLKIVGNDVSIRCHLK